MENEPAEHVRNKKVTDGEMVKRVAGTVIFGDEEGVDGHPGNGGVGVTDVNGGVEERREEVNGELVAEGRGKEATREEAELLVEAEAGAGVWDEEGIEEGLEEAADVGGSFKRAGTGDVSEILNCANLYSGPPTQVPHASTAFSGSTGARWASKRRSLPRARPLHESSRF